jgi:uncharacterized protein
LIAYLDTSALAKLIVSEPDSETVGAAWERLEGRYAAIHGYAELRAALGVAQRSGRVSAGEASIARGTLEQIWSRLVVVAIDGALVRDAGDLAERHGLRAGDAIHLASARRIATGTTAFMAFDARLRQAAAQEGFDVLPRRT